MHITIKPKAMTKRFDKTFHQRVGQIYNWKNEI